MCENTSDIFIEGLEENDRVKLLASPKSDIHNHSTKGCRREWLEERCNLKLAKPPVIFDGLEGMSEWFTSIIKPHFKGVEGIVIRWEGSFAEASRNNIKRLAMNFGVTEIDLVGGMDAFRNLIEGFHLKYCPDIVFEPELTYASRCEPVEEAARMSNYVSSGYFKSIDVCGGENIRSLEEFLPLYRKAEEYHLTKIMHVGESGSAEDIRRAVEMFGLDEVHHGNNAVHSDSVIRFLADNNIQLNICPSSNVMLGYVPDYKNHPIKKLYENGVKVTINTDDLLLFDSSIENEYLKLYNAGTLSAKQLNDIRLNGLRPRCTL